MPRLVEISHALLEKKVFSHVTAVSEHSVPLKAAEWQAHFSDHSLIFFNFQEKNRNFSSVKGF